MYEEEQTFKWAIPLFLSIALMTALPILFYYEKEDGILALVILAAVLLFTGGLFFSMKQIIRIDEQGVHYKQSPLINSFKTIPWGTIQNWEIKEISALKDFGGWGIRYTGSKTGYIMQGDFGLEMNTGKKRRIVLSVMNRGEVERLMRVYIGKS